MTALPELTWRLLKGYKKFVSPELKPTPYEAELLHILIEECAEVIQRATKMLRFGVREVQPGQPDDNARRMSLEIGDLEAIKALCVENGLADNITISAQIMRKMEKLSIYMQETKE